MCCYTTITAAALRALLATAHQLSGTYFARIGCVGLRGCWQAPWNNLDAFEFFHTGGLTNGTDRLRNGGMQC